ncbi:hypothetical protein GYA54_00685 [Candidatus Kuenenbacteria bacterium]|nr:hypothetical protein [Candidatus Kuenenbacteria bacterium]
MLSRKKLIIFILIVAPLFLAGCSFTLNSPQNNGTPQVSGGIYKSQNRGESWEAKNNFSGVGRVKIDIRKANFDIATTSILYAATNLGFFVSTDRAENWQPLIPNSDIADFAQNPKTKSIIYVASGNKVYKTSDSGAKWDIVYTEVRANASIKSLSVDPFDTSRVYLLENDGTLLLSLDWGNSWKPLYNFQKNSSKIIVDQYHNKNLYVAADNGLYYSFDGGVNWQEIIAAKNNEYPGINNFKNLFFINKEGTLLYLSRYGILRSLDSGKNWSALQLVSPPNTVDIEAFGYNPKDPNEIYYILEDIFYHTFDGGRNWQTKPLPASGKFRASSILVDPKDPNILYLNLTQ